MKITVLSLIILLIIVGCKQHNNKIELVDYVNPLIGTAPSKTISAVRHSINSETNAQVIPSVTMPFGMTNWTPQTRSVETKCIAPYYYNDSLITGFRGSHWLSGSCTQDYGSFCVMPITGKLITLPQNRGSEYSHKNEISTPYYYKVKLLKYAVDCEITATKRSGFLRFTFNKNENKYILIEPNSDYNEGYIKIIPETNEITGFNPVHRIYQGWGEKAGYSGYFVARFDCPVKSFGVYQESNLMENGTEISDKKNIGAYVDFSDCKSQTINVIIGTSFISIGNARENLDKEINNSGFDDLKNHLKQTWNEYLSKVKIETNSNTEKVKFYTALYHSLQQPRIYNDCNGEYPSFNGGKIIEHSNSNYYSDFSVWDTYRALHPLYNLIIPSTNKDMMTSLFSMAEQGGWLPIFPCWNSYTSAMIGDHAISLIADAYIKDVINISENNYFYLKQNATKSPENFKDYLDGKGRRALKSYLKYGYIPLEDSVKESFHRQEQVSRTLEYAYDDFTLSQIAKKMGKQKDSDYFMERSKNYKNVFDKTVECVRGRFEDGTFTKDFNKTERMPYITEGTPWQYTWYVPQDINGLISLMGGKKEFNKNLEDFFNQDQYWHGNEPGHQIPFLFTYSGEPDKTNEIVSKIRKEEYDDTPGGLSGNDDSGQISAWYVFASMGLYPVCPGTDEYAVFLPAFDKTSIQLENGNIFSIIAEGVEEGKKEVKEIKLNGEKLDKNIIHHEDIVKGGRLEFILD